MEPKPAGPLPLLIGGGGEKRTLRIAARYADEWNVWSTPDVFAQKSSVLDRHCADLDRDPPTIHRSTQALLFLSDDEEFLAKMRGRDIGMQDAWSATPSELIEIVGRLPRRRRRRAHRPRLHPRHRPASAASCSTASCERSPSHFEGPSAPGGRDAPIPSLR